MKHLKIYEVLTLKMEKEKMEKEKIERECRNFKIYNFTINENDLSVDVDDDVILNGITISHFPFKFKKISGDFSCLNTNLWDLKNCPSYVGNGFNCSYNRELTTLLEGPKQVNSYYYCYNCNLKDVYGFPEIFSGDMKMHANPVTEILYLSFSSKFIKFLNEYLVIRNQNTVIESRLMDALYEVGAKEELPFQAFANYKLV